MQQAKVSSWNLSGDYWIPVSVNTVCPQCKEHSALTTRHPSHHSQTQTLVMSGQCVRCEKESKVWIIGVRQRSQEQGCEVVWVFPQPPIARQLKVKSDGIPPGIFNAYKEAVNCFNAGFWRATVTECGRALEGITRDKFPKSSKRKSLNTALQGLETDLGVTGYDALFKPILQLGNAVRLGRNTSAHFDVEKDPDRVIAEEILDLAEYLLKYFYVLPLKAIDLEARIKALGSTGSDEEEDDQE